jgi:hypothetical protein
MLQTWVSTVGTPVPACNGYRTVQLSAEYIVLHFLIEVYKKL